MRQESQLDRRLHRMVESNLTQHRSSSKRPMPTFWMMSSPLMKTNQQMEINSNRCSSRRQRLTQEPICSHTSMTCLPQCNLKDNRTTINNLHTIITVRRTAVVHSTGRIHTAHREETHMAVDNSMELETHMVVFNNHTVVDRRMDTWASRLEAPMDRHQTCTNKIFPINSKITTRHRTVSQLKEVNILRQTQQESTIHQEMDQEPQIRLTTIYSEMVPLLEEHRIHSHRAMAAYTRQSPHINNQPHKRINLAILWVHLAKCHFRAMVAHSRGTTPPHLPMEMHHTVLRNSSKA
mmetsp:Transcript_2828/g.10806  ORF Transcript_2828/g.10806 Transcript_2828/m.10806 type:complete len:293 (-) Transcript_2828:1076-1954(-)